MRRPAGPPAMVTAFLRTWAGTALDLVYPRACAVCGTQDPADGTHLCWDCRSEIQWIQPPFCSRCGTPVSGRIDHAYECAACTARKIHFDAARAAGRMEGPLAEMIHLLKYRNGFWIASDLADLLQAALRTHFDPGEIDAAGFVPLFPSRRRDRGYNQAEVLARLLCRRSGVALLKRGLVRTRPTPTQTLLTASARADNVRNAFRVPNPKWVEGRRILLVDDVMTTGSTVNECSRVLKAAGAARVWVLTAAHG